MLISLDPLQHSFKSKPQAAKESGYVRRSLQATWRAMPQPLFVEANVFQFGTQFRMGAKSPMETLFSEKYRLHVQDGSEARPPNPALHFSEENSDRIDAWLNAPPEKRVFVIGARRDAFYVQKLRERYASSGIQFFFYQDCTPLCRESTVGAFFRTASAVIKVDSVAAQHSKFIPLEKRLTAEHNKTGRRLLLIDGDEAMRLLNSGGGGGTATLLACEIDALVSEDPLCK